MKTKLVCVVFALSLCAQAQIPSSFFAMNAQLTGPSNAFTLQFPEQTVTTVDSSNFATSPIGSLGHPTTFAWGWVETSLNTYDWSLIDPVLLAAHNQGVNIVLTIAWTPQWAADTTQSGSCHTGNGPGGQT